MVSLAYEQDVQTTTTSHKKNTKKVTKKKVKPVLSDFMPRTELMLRNEENQLK